MERGNPKKEKELSEMQENFLNILFGEAGGDLRTAADLAGYSRKTKIANIVKPIKEELVERAYLHLASSSPKAVIKLVGLLDKPTQLGAKELISAAKEILDRGGVIKTDKLSVDGPSNSIFILPPKQPVKEEN